MSEHDNEAGAANVSDSAAPTEASRAFDTIMRDYLSHGDAGLAALKKDVNTVRPSPVLKQFAEDMHNIIRGRVSTPTARINEELGRREIDAITSGDNEFRAPTYDDDGAYAAVVELWDHLGLQVDENDKVVTSGQVKRAQGVQQRLWVSDPVDALKTWWSWPLAATAAVGALGVLGFFQISTLFASSTGRVIFLTLSFLSFLVMGVGGLALSLRRARYIDPDAFLRKPKRKKS